MDHLEAKRLHASEKYVLGELSAEQRDAYEEHYFDCAECAEDVKATLTFVSAGREVFREEPVPAYSAPKELARRPRWASWLRPLIAVPAVAVLLLVVGYYTRSSKPQIGVITAPGQSLTSSPSFGLRGGDRLENEKTVVQVQGPILSNCTLILFLRRTTISRPTPVSYRTAPTTSFCNSTFRLTGSTRK